MTAKKRFAPIAPGLELQVDLEQAEFRLQVELRIAPGETLILVGPSGSGKSTLLRTIAGLIRPQRGRITLNHRALLDTERSLDLPPWKRRLGLVFQDFALFPHLTVEQNVLYGLKGIPEARKRVTEWLRAFGLEEFTKRFPVQLSGGQQQRVALARAAASNSDLLLLDEPFASLDTATRRTVRGELRRFLQRAAGGAMGEEARAVLLVTHDYLDALTLGDRIAVLENGKLTQMGARDEVLRQPRTPFLAALTGHNVLEGEAMTPVPGSDLREVRVGPLLFHVAEAGDIPSGPVFLAFGPQEVSLMRNPSEISARNQFPAVVREIVPLPDRLRVYLDAGIPLLADIVRPAATSLALEEGRRVVVAIKSTAIEVYR